MDIKIKYTRLPHTPALERYVGKKMRSIERLLGGLKSNLIVFVEIARTSSHHKQGKDVYYTEATMKISGKVIRAQSTDASIWAAIDKVKDVLRRKLRKYKEQKRLR